MSPSAFGSAPKVIGAYRLLLVASFVIAILSLLILNPISAASALSNSSSTSNNQTSSQQLTTNSQSSSTKSAAQPSSKTSAESRSSSAESKGQSVEQQQSQPTDVSSMYVQIPIAEPGDTGVPDGVQQTLTSTGDSDSTGDSGADSKGAAWTGPWPKKFQIGYIKQSDLHQVLIESLKGDSFVAVGAPSTSPVKSNPTQPASSSAPASAGRSTKNLAAPEPFVVPKPTQTSWPMSSVYGSQHVKNQPRPKTLLAKNLYHSGQPTRNFREAKFMDQQQQLPYQQQQQQQMLNRYQQQMMSFNQGRPNFNQQKMIPMVGQQHQQQQLQFAGFPSNLFSNQPMYTINNYPHHEQLDSIQMHNQFSMGPQTSPLVHQLGRAQKSNDQYSSWRPVTSDKSEQTVEKTSQMDAQLGGDSFDDGFNSPSKDASLGNSMNRHPMLNSYLGGANDSKLSPAMKMKQQQQQQGVKGTAQVDKSGTKSAVGGVKTGSSQPTSAPGSTKGQDSNAILPNMNRRNVQNNTSVTTSSSVDSTTVTTSTSTSAADEQSNSTTVAPSASSTVTAPTTTQENETTEPDSESVESDTTEPTTTTAATDVSSSTQTSVSNQPEQTTSSSSSTTTASSDESEVATQGSVQQSNANLPTLPESDEAGTSRSSTTTTASSGAREETTPSSGSPSSTSEAPNAASEQAKGEVEGAGRGEAKNSRLDSLSDEALLAAAVRTGSEIGKTNGIAQRQRVSSSSSKRTRSSERLSQLQPNQSARKSTSASKTNSRKTSSGNRSGKQVSGDTSVGVKGAASKVASTTRKSAKLEAANKQSSSQKKRASSSKGSKQVKSSKSTRMSEKLQQAQVVSMSAAQAQSTAQTLASLLLSRCLSSSNCMHLLDICTTKQAAVPLGESLADARPTSEAASGESSSNLTAAWSMPVGLMSSQLMSLTQALQADKVLRVFPQWKDSLENVVDQDSQTGYTLILPSNEAIDRLPAATIDSWLANADLLNQIIDNHILDSSETIESIAGNNRQSNTRVIKSKGLQINQHREKMVTINGRRVVYANQAAPCK